MTDFSDTVTGTVSRKAVSISSVRNQRCNSDNDSTTSFGFTNGFLIGYQDDYSLNRTVPNPFVPGATVDLSNIGCVTFECVTEALGGVQASIFGATYSFTSSFYNLTVGASWSISSTTLEYNASPFYWRGVFNPRAISPCTGNPFLDSPDPIGELILSE
ncbi:hypothetical protein EBZ39_03725 [bacterium]|nr:hypothetical protein [bacterium]